MPNSLVTKKTEKLIKLGRVLSGSNVSKDFDVDEFRRAWIPVEGDEMPFYKRGKTKKKRKGATGRDSSSSNGSYGDDDDGLY
jgi:hypothetical protein